MKHFSHQRDCTVYPAVTETKDYSNDQGTAAMSQTNEYIVDVMPSAFLRNRLNDMIASIRIHMKLSDVDKSQ
jgi:hypothetical protein